MSLPIKARFEFDEVVIAVGAWSGILSEKLGISLPLQGGKGYSMLFDGLGDKIKIPTIMLEARATATPMGNQLRCAGTMEIVGIDLSVNMNRVKGIINGVNSFYPDLAVSLPEKEAVWSGLRPCSPDGLPFIGRWLAMLARLRARPDVTGVQVQSVRGEKPVQFSFTCKWIPRDAK